MLKALFEEGGLTLLKITLMRHSGILVLLFIIFLVLVVSAYLLIKWSTWRRDKLDIIATFFEKYFAVTAFSCFVLFGLIFIAYQFISLEKRENKIENDFKKLFSPYIDAYSNVKPLNLEKPPKIKKSGLLFINEDVKPENTFNKYNWHWAGGIGRSGLIAKTPGLVNTLILLKHDYSPNPIASYHSGAKAYRSRLRVRIVDFKTNTLIKEKWFYSKEDPPTIKSYTADWKAEMVSDGNAIDYLKTLGIKFKDY